MRKIELGKFYILWQKEQNNLIDELKTVINYFAKKGKVVKAVYMCASDYTDVFRKTKTNSINAKGNVFQIIASDGINPQTFWLDVV